MLYFRYQITRKVFEYIYFSQNSFLKTYYNETLYTFSMYYRISTQALMQFAVM